MACKTGYRREKNFATRISKTGRTGEMTYGRTGKASMVT